MAALQAKKQEWTACLAKSGGVPGKCEKLEKELASMSKASGVDCCIDETVGLMRCTASGARSQGCGAEFLAMRECNRSSGRELTKEAGGGCAVAPGKAGIFASDAASLVSSAAPARSLKGMTDFGEEYAKSLGIAPGEVRF
eukprot:CAMPEP_0115234102 /NCGR_PEP_ID=MMETSP0270-20121206/34618_1 /TAXON_ID=71861 /ORGANISM="Scrippsiella trochoidea, Strain CCMP3099" /LENGTH=140 /DNA_ID=CAMNT_0002648835 /DNA_START=107 /DNA_END=529 /DNA_ORIENTATION=+